MVKSLSEYLVEKLNEEVEIAEAAQSIKDEKSFREAARAKFEEVFGEKLDEDKMNDIIEGILKKYKDDVEAGAWGKLIGVLNKSF